MLTGWLKPVRSNPLLSHYSCCTNTYEYDNRLIAGRCLRRVRDLHFSGNFAVSKIRSTAGSREFFTPHKSSAVPTHPLPPWWGNFRFPPSWVVKRTSHDAEDGRTVPNPPPFFLPQNLWAAVGKAASDGNTAAAGYANPFRACRISGTASW